MGAFNSSDIIRWNVTNPIIENHNRRRRLLANNQNFDNSSTDNIQMLDSTVLLMGADAPPLYEAALVGKWTEVLHRCQTHPMESLYQDKSKNRALHLACRRQPPVDVVTALIRAEKIAAKTKFKMTQAGAAVAAGGRKNKKNKNKNGAGSISINDVTITMPLNGMGGSATTGGCTALHFACYFGAKQKVIEILLLYEMQGLGKKTNDDPPEMKQPNDTLHFHHSLQNYDHLESRGIRHPNSPPNPIKVKQQEGQPLHLDERGRTPLHCACSGMRTSHRPTIIKSLLNFNPSSATIPDENGMTPFSLLHADYADEIKEVLHPSISAQDARLACCCDSSGYSIGNGSANGKLDECWRILILLLKAAYLGTLKTDIDSESTERDEFDNHPGKLEEKKNGQSFSSSFGQSSDSNSSEQRHRPNPRKRLNSSDNEVDLNNTLPLFQVVHAACACVYSCPKDFSELIFKVCDVDKIKERNTDFHLPLHLATRSIPPCYENTIKDTNEKICYKFSDGACITITYKADSTTNKDLTNNFIQDNEDDLMVKSMTEQRLLATMSFVTKYLLKGYPEAASIPDDESSKFPLLLALESGKPWKGVVQPLLLAYPELLMDNLSTSSSRSRQRKSRHRHHDDPTDQLIASSLSGFSSSSSSLGSNSSSINVTAAVHASLMTALASPNRTIRDETADTVGQLIKDWSDNTTFTSDAKCEKSHISFRSNDFIRNLIRVSGRYGSTRSRSGQTSGAMGENIEDEWAGVQSTMLRALANALTHVSQRMLDIPEIPKLSLDMAYSMLCAEDDVVRDGAARVIASALALLGDDQETQFGVMYHVVLRLRPGGSQMSEYQELGNHSLHGGSQSTSGTMTMSRRNSILGHAEKILAPAAIRRQIESFSKKDHQEQLDIEFLRRESVIMKHGRAAACYRMFESSTGSLLAKNNEILNESTNLVKNLLIDEDTNVRKVACLAMGAILGRSPDTITTLKEIKCTIIKCMRATEEAAVHIHLARGLILATKMQPQIFLNKVGGGSSILEGALMLAIAAPHVQVQRMFHSFLWLALGMDETTKSTKDEGLTKYMGMAEGENGKIMMSLVTKSLEKIERVIVRQ